LLLNLARKLGHLRALLLIGRRNVHREQQVQPANSHMDLASPRSNPRSSSQRANHIPPTIGDTFRDIRFANR
jgi:hypothetical protein